MTIHRRFDAGFWFATAVAILLAGSVSCFVYAGMQFDTDSATARHGFDGIAPKLRSPISFERGIPSASASAQSNVGPLAGGTGFLGADVVAAEVPR